MAMYKENTRYLMIFLLCVLQYVKCDMFTAVAEMENVLSTERLLAQRLRSYVELEQDRLTKLIKIADDYEEHSDHALKDPEMYLSNALNAYLLVKKFTIDWNEVSSLLTRNTGEEFLETMSSEINRLPKEEDLIGSATALLRLQDTYNLPTSAISTGHLQGVKESLTLSAGDCFELGRISYNNGDHYHVILWMTEALEVHKSESNSTINIPLTLDYLAYSTYMQGNVRSALNLTLQWIELEPNNQRALNNKKYYEQMLAEQDDSKGDEGEQNPRTFQNKRMLDEYRQSEEFSNYEALCRGEHVYDIPNVHKLTCQYKRHNVLFYLSPLKEETLFFDPWLVQYHDVLTDHEVKVIKKLAKPRLHRSGVFSLDGEPPKENHYSSFRTSKGAWLKDEEHAIVKRVSGKVRALSNLTLDTAEELQVVNYGIGGHYEPHYDFARKDEVAAFDPRAGNRIATAIFYLTDVTAGGLTVFPQIGAKVKPIGKSLAFWYNLKKSGEGDYQTRHAGCPVLTGVKWVANKWIHERGQEFVRPCDHNPAL